MGPRHVRGLAGSAFGAISNDIETLPGSATIRLPPLTRKLPSLNIQPKDTAAPPAPAPAKRSFAAMRHPGFRAQFVTFVLAMMADNIEHVISYWVMFQKFHSPALAGFAIVSHWLPFLLFSVVTGALSDRFDPRRIIQCGMLLFILVSLGWGYFFITDTLQMWQAMVLLVVHGCAGVLWFRPRSRCCSTTSSARPI